MRDDKQAHPKDVRIDQISEQVEVALTDCDAKNYRLPETKLLKREVFVKQAKGKTMVRKFVLLKTNKEDDTDEYPGYVLHYTDFSPNRKSPLDRDVWVSDSLPQIESLFLQCKQENIKKGWEPYGAAPEVGDVAVDEKPVKKKAAKKKATKKTAKKKTEAKAPAKKKKATKKTAKK